MAIKSPRRMMKPTIYQVGVDISQDEYARLVDAVTEWFKEIHDTKRPREKALDMLDRCLKGITRDGRPNFNLALSPFAKRVKVMCRFDMETWQGIPTGSRRVREKRKARLDALDRIKDQEPVTPAERKIASQKADYGDDPTVMLNATEAENWQRHYESYKQDFPWLHGMGGDAELRLLCDLHILADRLRMNALAGRTISALDDLDNIAKQIGALKRSLGIHPDQLAKRVEEKVETSIGEAMARMDEPDLRALRMQYFLEELTQSFQMYHSLRADGTGYQLDEFGLFATHRCRTCACAKCGQRNVAGFAIEEIEERLVKEGILEPIDPPREAAG